MIVETQSSRSGQGCVFQVVEVDITSVRGIVVSEVIVLHFDHLAVLAVDRTAIDCLII
jgi:hypothetical protein